MVSKEKSRSSKIGKLHGIPVVYVDDFLFQATECAIRTGLLDMLGTVWKLDKEVSLSMKQSLTFLGIDTVMGGNGDVLLHQERFVNTLLEKYSMQSCRDNRCVQIDKLPTEDDMPIISVLRQLQS